MAWTIENAFGPNGLLLSPETEWVEGERERFETVALALTLQISRRFDELGRPWNTADQPPPSDKIYLTHGWRFPLTEAPYRFRLRQPDSSLPDILSTDAGWAITKAVVDAIESIEPGVHQYLTCEILSHDGGSSEKRWLLNVCSRLDTIALEYSNIRVHKGSGLYVPGPGPFDAAVRKNSVTGRALWCEYRFNNKPLISDSFQSLIIGSGFNGWCFDGRFSSHHLREID